MCEGEGAEMKVCHFKKETRISLSPVPAIHDGT